MGFKLYQTVIKRKKKKKERWPCLRPAKAGLWQAGKKMDYEIELRAQSKAAG